MKVKELIELLMDHDADASVVVISNPNWPTEHRVAGVATRADCHGALSETRYETDTAPGDVFIVEGAWLRYAHVAAWDVAHDRRSPPDERSR